MKAILEFNLPDEQEEFQLAANAVKWMSFANEFSQFLRAECKYNADTYTEDQYRLLEQIRERFHEMLNEEGLSL